MNINFDKCMEMLLEQEGGYVKGNKIGDPGGITNMGVTKRTYDEYHRVDMSEEGMKNLTVEDVTPIYKDYYWYRCSCERLPSGVDWAVFDTSVNHGTGRVAKFLQKAVGANMDGSTGPLTLANMGLSNQQKSSIGWLSIATPFMDRLEPSTHLVKAGSEEMTRLEKPLWN